jgi:hypothetical protein
VGDDYGAAAVGVVAGEAASAVGAAIAVATAAAAV